MIIIINGSRNAGKTTIAKLLSKKLPRTAYIPIDSLREFIRFMNLEKSILLNLEGAVLLTKNYVKQKYNVILEYCLRKEDYKYLLKELRSANTDIYTFTLRPERALALSNRGNRQLSVDDKKRITQQYHKRSLHFIPPLGITIDITKEHSSAKVVKIILDSLRHKI